MLKKNTSTAPATRNATRNRNISPVNASVLKPIYPATTNQSHKKISEHQNSTAPSAFLLPSSEFFVVDKDSLVLSESDIFQTNLARRQQHQHQNQQQKNFVSSVGSSTGIVDPSSSTFYHEDLGFNFEDKENVSIYDKKRPTKTSQLDSINSSAAANANTADKGLRHFSAKVCAKVEEKGVTTYNEVADDLVQEIGLEMGKCDHKNIRRRVYDALNVLMAIDIIRKEKKEIRWLGLPNEAADDLRQLEAERSALQERINEKNRNLKEVLRRCISLKNLIDRNSELQSTNHSSHQGDKLPLPFILISAARDCHVHCEMLEDRTQYFFEFNTAFQINEDIELMRRMGLDTARIERIKSFFPKELVAQVLLLCLNNQQSNSTSNISTNTHFSNSSSSNTVNNPAYPHNINNNNNNNNNNSNINNNNSFHNSHNANVFAPIIGNQDLNLDDLDAFSSSPSSSL